MIERTRAHGQEMTWHIAGLIILSLLLASCTEPAPLPPLDTEDWLPKERLGVSLIQLIATPEAYDGQQVSVMGVLRLDFEGTVLYLGKEDARHRVLRNAIWLRLSPEQEKRWKFLEGRYVLLGGRFDAQSHGHFGNYAGSIEEIDDVMPWPPDRGGS